MLTNTENNTVRDVLRRAGDLLLEYWPGGNGLLRDKLAISHKHDGTRVTNADLLSNEIIERTLKQLFPDDGFVSEESRDHSERTNARVWLIDPLDSTENFIHGAQDFSILSALVQNHVVIFGAMYLPARDQYCWAARGAGSFLNSNLLRVSGIEMLDLTRVNLRHCSLKQASGQPVAWLDSASAILMLCAGELDGVVIRVGRRGEWDLAAAEILIRESGGTVSDEYGQPIEFNRGGMSCRFFIGSNSKIHTELVAMVAQGVICPTY